MSSRYGRRTSLLSPAQEKAALLLAEGVQITKVANEIERSRNTIADWLKKNTEFKQRVNELQRNISQEAVDLLRHNLVENVQIIQDIAAGDVGPIESPLQIAAAVKSANIRLRAAMWSADKILVPAMKGADVERPNAPSKAQQEAHAALVNMDDEDMDDLASRGYDDE